MWVFNVLVAVCRHQRVVQISDSQTPADGARSRVRMTAVRGDSYPAVVGVRNERAGGSQVPMVVWMRTWMWIRRQMEGKIFGTSTGFQERCDGCGRDRCQCGQKCCLHHHWSPNLKGCRICGGEQFYGFLNRRSLTPRRARSPPPLQGAPYGPTESQAIGRNKKGAH